MSLRLGRRANQAVEIPTSSQWCQRWRHGQHSWRHVREGGFDQHDYELHPISHNVAKAYVLEQHYLRSFPSASFRFGLFDTRDGDMRLVGAAVFGGAARDRVLTLPFPTLEPYRESLVLSRFVLDDDVPANAESWFLARCHSELLAAGIRGVVTFADPLRRVDEHGFVVAAGHVGTIYKATNAIYAGRASARKLTVFRSDGRVFNDRAAQKVRTQDQGHDYVEQMLVRRGATPLRAGQDPAHWLERALTEVGVDEVTHLGNHRYLFTLGRNQHERDAIPLGLSSFPYPKGSDAT